MGKNYRRTTFLFFVLCYLLLSPAGKAGAAAPEAKIGNRVYATLGQAVKAVKNGETVKLLRNVKTSSPLLIKRRRRFTLDLNGKSYTYTGTKGRAAVYLVNGQMTILEGTMKSARKELLRVGRAAKLSVRNGQFDGSISNYGKLTVKNGSFSAVKQRKWLFYNKGTLVLKNGSYEAYGNVVLNEKNGKATLRGGTFTNTCRKNYPVIYSRSGKKGKLTITGGRFSGDGLKEVVFNKSGKCYIKGGTITNRMKNGIPGKRPALANGEEGVMYLSKGLVSSRGYAAVGNSGKLTVSGGILMGSKKYALLSNKGETIVKGGMFKTFDDAVGYSIYNWPQAALTIKVADYFSHFSGRIMEGEQLLWSPTLGNTEKDAAETASFSVCSV